MRKIFYTIRVAGMIIRFVFRFFSGRPLSGDRKTDSTFFRPATRSLDPSHTALRWEMMRGVSRAAWRVGVSYLLLLLPISLLLLRISGAFTELPPLLRPSVVISVHGVLLISGVSAYLLRRYIREYGVTLPVLRRNDEEKLRISVLRVEGRRGWHREKVLPLARAASMILGQHIPDRKAGEHVRVPKNYRDAGGAPVEILLPTSFPGDAGVKKRLLSAAEQKLGMKSPQAVWQLEGSAPRVLISSPPEPPSFVSVSDVRHFLESMGEWDFFYGVIGTGEAFSISISGDTPHGAVSCGSGGGKSELLKGKIAQAGHKGWFTIIMDWKEESQEWAENLPGVRYVKSVEAIHDMCVALGEEVEWRKTHKGEPRVRTLVVAEEWNITAPLLTEYWNTLRSTAGPEEKRSMPTRSPAITSLMKAIFTGRSLGLFIELVTIRFSTRVTNGNGDLRESFQVINMARWKSQTVKMLAPDIRPFPKKPSDPGRWVAVNGETAVIYQAPLWANAEAVEWHQSGLPIPHSPWSEHYSPSSRGERDTSRTLDDQFGGGQAAPNWDMPELEGEIVPDIDARKLTNMVSALEPLGITLDILRHAAKDTKSGFPGAFGGSQFKGYTYDFAAVTEWARKRHASQQSERVNR